MGKKFLIEFHPRYSSYWYMSILKMKIKLINELKTSLKIGSHFNHHPTLEIINYITCFSECTFFRQVFYINAG
jgi:hypothetical protein